MSKKENVIEVRVVVEPRRLGNYGFISMSESLVEPDPEERIKRYRQICNSIIDDIKRHVDNAQNVYLDEIIETVCEHCGSTWTEGDSDHNGGCCDIDCKVFKKQVS